MTKILFITSRNIENTSGELRLIKGRAYSMYNFFGISTVFFAVSPQKRLLQKREMLNDSDELHIFPYKNIFDYFKAHNKLRRQAAKRLAEEHFDAVVFSGVIPAKTSYYIKRKNPGIKIIFDCHGIYEELIEFNPSLTKLLYFKYIEHNERKTLKIADAAFVVTNELKKYISEKYKVDLKYFVVPCAMSADIPTYEQALEYRKRYRDEFGISPQQTLFVYSGGTSPWQSIDDAYQIFETYRNTCDSNAKFLLMTPNPVQAEYKNTIIRSYSYEEVNKAIFAGDVAMLIRGNFVTNHMAFPNKFLEYVRSNMLIVTTPYLNDISKYVRQESLGMIFDSQTSLESLLDAVNSHTFSHSEYERRISFAKSFDFTETLRGFAEYLERG